MPDGECTHTFAQVFSAHLNVFKIRCHVQEPVIDVRWNGYIALDETVQRTRQHLAQNPLHSLLSFKAALQSRVENFFEMFGFIVHLAKCAPLALLYTDEFPIQTSAFLRVSFLISVQVTFVVVGC